jgi:F-box/WD-40 domain protein 7
MIYTKKYEIREHQGAIFSLTKDNTFIYTASADRYVTRWNPFTGLQDTFVIKCESSIYKIIHFKHKNILVVGTSNGDIHIIDSENKSELKFIKFHNVAVFEIQIDEFNHRMYVGDADGNLSVWNTENWSLILNLPFDCGKIRAIDFLGEDSNKLVIGSQDGYVRVIETNYYNLITSFNTHNGGCLALSETEFKKNILFSSGKDGYIRAWKMDTCKEVIAIPAHNESIYKLFEKNGLLYSISRDKTLKIWDSNSLDFIFKIERKIGGHTHSINDLLFFDDLLFTVGDDKRIICWETSCIK